MNIKKYKPNKIEKVLNKNFIYLMSDFYQMQTDLWSNINKVFHDFEKAYIILFILKKHYDKKNIQNESNQIKISITEISKKLFLAKETVRRKILELENVNILIKNKKKISIDVNNLEIIKIYKTHEEVSSRFISKFSFFLKKNEFFGTFYNVTEIKNYINKNIDYHFNLFIKFQINWYSIYKPNFPDFTTMIIFLLIVLNNTYYIQKKKEKKSKINFIKSFKDIHILHDSYGLNATSISELTSIPRASVLRKMNFLILEKLVRKNSKSLYYLNDLTKSNFAKKHFITGVPKVMILLSDYLSSSYGSFR